MSIDLYCAECGECLGELGDVICDDCLRPKPTEAAQRFIDEYRKPFSMDGDRLTDGEGKSLFHINNSFIDNALCAILNSHPDIKEAE